MVFYHQPTNLLKKIASTCRTFIIPMVLFPLSTEAMEKGDLQIEGQISRVEVPYIDSRVPDILEEDDTLFTPAEEQRDQFLRDENLVLDHTTKQSFAGTGLDEVFGLAMDGGGMRGYTTARYLVFLRDLLVESGYNIPLSKVFDCVGGTSIGGILSLGVGADLAPDKLVEIFLEHGERIFPTKGQWKARLMNLGGLIGCRFSPEPLKGLLQEQLGVETTLGDTSTNVVVTACTTKGQPKLFKSFSKEDQDNELWKIGLCTSAAPTYFPSFNLTEQDAYVDGGMWCNNPALHVMINMAKELHGGTFSPSNLHILSLGTGDTSLQTLLGNNIGYTSAGTLIDVLMTSNSQGTHEMMDSLLGRTYYRVNPLLGRAINLADVSRDTIDVLERYADHHSQKDIIKDFAKDYVKFNRTRR
ncbi:patatin-like phospholipase family protein [Candidatus Paracaedibacter symbiosus]|uniref:patatin-like phospholipase family protein n=1 Tax=Candidatus Paracaedibacter symbiosus TaxID=244582 RepID=UPI000509E9B5|nr:patatin-like phospholipase family protein [Candidatus Paracaedibacter symbiosus]